MYRAVIEYLNRQLKGDYGSIMAKRSRLAKELGYSDWTLTNILRGHLEPSKRFLECIADYYNIAVVYCKGRYIIEKR